MNNRVVVFDDNPLVIAGLSHVLSQEHYDVVEGTSNAEELILSIRRLQPDFIIVDPQKMEQDTLVHLGRLEDGLQHLKIIVFSSSEGVLHLLRSNHVNIQAYLSKNQPIEHLIAIMRNPPEKKYRMIDIPNASRATKQSDLDLFKNLTGREIQVLRQISAGKTNKIIAEEMHLSNKTISTYKRSIMEKFHTNDIRVIIDFARRHGF